MIAGSMCTSKWPLVQAEDEMYPRQKFIWGHKGKKNKEERREEKEMIWPFGVPTILSKLWRTKLKRNKEINLESCIARSEA